MKARAVLKAFLPIHIKRLARKKFNNFRRSMFAPRMLWGYENINGEYLDKTRISDTVFLYHPERINFANNAFVWHYTILDGTGGLEIGEGSQIGAWVGIFTHSSHIAIRIYGAHYQDVPENEKKGYPTAPVVIGKYVFVGAGSIILPGVTIGKGALVFSGSLVNRNVGEFEIVAGSPAKVIGTTKDIDLKYLEEDEQLMAWYREWSAGGG
ncbi:MAG: acyltransferase [Anaerolineales bacterium]|nr:acyltransferase [Anaerolineales bacterium]